MPRGREVEFGINSPVKTRDYHGYHTNGPPTDDEFHAHSHLRRTLEDINVLDDQSRADIESGKFGSMIWKDFKSNFTVVTIPAIFTNALWRGMNIGGIAVQDSPAMVIVETTAYIATLVWVLCSLIDMIRQLYLAGWSFSEYRATDGPRASFNLGWKFFMGVIGWTVGYEIAAGTHMFYAGTDTVLEYTTHAIGAAIGEFFGLLVACELTHISEFIITGKLSTHPPTGSLGVATKGILEGAVWSVIGDANLYARWGSTAGSGVADSFILGLAAALGFSVMGILTSMFGYWFIHRRLRLEH